MKYITILEPNNSECPNIGTITSQNSESSFKKAIESYFDAEMIKYKFVNVYTVNDLTDCIDAVPIDVLVEINVDGSTSEHKVTLSETWLY
jgi:hypothetical protein